MADPSSAALELTPSEIELLVEALDAYEYWQLGDLLPRDDGELILPDDLNGTRYWDHDQQLTADQAQAVAEAHVCRAIAARLRSAAAP